MEKPARVSRRIVIIFFIPKNTELDEKIDLPGEKVKIFCTPVRGKNLISVQNNSSGSFQF